ncbi:hypothetical protein GCM10010387_08060 [Streptomyces inusitatus]|uniref:Uncharacterized protein n=1 Tax=Streptomyces inusitatus TaxID=68221 RepID=A0A918UL89_9ACTN|nr:DUF5949 family protein [Streptomyces inusitatus]GGZ18040.1 hypothetical protein GCM10010387_08060 [Streptomyces inusitatus]
MTLANSAKNTVQRGHLGTVSMLAWTGDPDAGHDMPYLLVYSLGDGDGGPEAGVTALEGLIRQGGLAVDGTLTDATPTSFNSPIRLLVQGGRAVLNMPGLSAQCPAPVEWLAAAESRGHAHLLISTRPWPEATPGEPLTEELLQSYVGDEGTLLAAAHALLPVSRLRG